MGRKVWASEDFFLGQGVDFPILQISVFKLTGTKKLIDACVECGVGRLVLCSTVDVVIGFDDIENGCEQTTEKPNKFLFPGYPETKYMQENMVLQTNGKQTVNGKTHTVNQL